MNRTPFWLIFFLYPAEDYLQRICTVNLICEDTAALFFLS